MLIKMSNMIIAYLALVVCVCDLAYVADICIVGRRFTVPLTLMYCLIKVVYRSCFSVSKIDQIVKRSRSTTKLSVMSYACDR